MPTYFDVLLRSPARISTTECAFSDVIVYTPPVLTRVMPVLAVSLAVRRTARVEGVLAVTKNDSVELLITLESVFIIASRPPAEVASELPKVSAVVTVETSVLWVAPVSVNPLSVSVSPPVAAVVTEIKTCLAFVTWFAVDGPHSAVAPAIAALVLKPTSADCTAENTGPAAAAAAAVPKPQIKVILSQSSIE